MMPITVNHTFGKKFYNAYVKVSDQKAYNVNGGTSIANTWTTRDINTEDSDTEGICSVAANQITLDAGTYNFYIDSSFYPTGRAILRLYDTTGSSDLAVGKHVYSATTDMINAKATGVFTIAVQSAIELQYYFTTAQATNGLGVSQNSDSNYPSIFTIAEFWRRA